jgi:hypothetical protein
MNELKKCPFCGNEFVESEVVGLGHYAIVCACGARTGDCDYVHEADKIWNHRPIEDKLASELIEAVAHERHFVVLARKAQIEVQKEAKELRAESEVLRAELMASNNRMKTLLAILPPDYKKSVEVQIKFNNRALKES